MYLAREHTGADAARHRRALRRAQPHDRHARLPAHRPAASPPTPRPATSFGAHRAPASGRSAATAAVRSGMTDRLRRPVHHRCALPSRTLRPFRAPVHISTTPMTSIPISRGGHRESRRPRRSDAPRAAAGRLARGVDAQRRPGALRRADRRRGRRRAARHRHGGRPARSARTPSSSATAPSSCPARLLARRRPPAACRRRLARAAPGRAGRRGRRRHRALPHPHAARRGLPPLPEPGGDQVVTVPAPAFVETIAARRPLGLARRDAADPHRHPRLGRRRRAADGRHRLLPPRASRRPRSSRRCAGGFEANVPARALRGARPHRAQATPTTSASACAPTRSSSRSTGSSLSSRLDRRSVPELPPAAARGLRARADDQPATSSLEVVRRISLHGPEERARCGCAFSEGELTRLGADAGRRRGQRARCRFRSPASRSRSASTPSS